MGGSTDATSPTTVTTSPLTGPSSLGSAVGPTAPDLPHHGKAHDVDDSLDQRVLSTGRSSADSPHESRGSSIGRSFDEKHLEATTPQYGYSGEASAAPRSHETFETPNGIVANGHRPHPGPNRLTKPVAPKKERRGGLRNTIRRMFGRSPKSRISLPTQIVQPRHVRSLNSCFWSID